MGCFFRIPEKKKSTARAVFYNDFNIKNSYTVEASFGGYEINNNNNLNNNTNNLINNNN